MQQTSPSLVLKFLELPLVYAATFSSLCDTIKYIQVYKDIACIPSHCNYILNQKDLKALIEELITTQCGKLSIIGNLGILLKK